MGTECFSCGAIKLYSSQAAEYTEKLTDALQMPMLTMIGVLSALWIVIEGIRLSLHATSINEVAKGFIVLIIAAAALANGGAMIQGIYTGSLDIMGGVAAVAFKVGGGQIESSGYDGIEALAANAEQAMLSVLQAAQTVSWQGTLYNPLPWLYALLIAVPYIILIVLYMAQVTMGIFRIMMVATFSPLLVLCAGFKQTMPIAVSGVRTLFASILVVFSVTVAISMIIYGATSLDIGNSLSGVADEKSGWQSWLSNGKILIAIALGWLGSALMFEATGIANSMAQVALGNSGAATMSGGIIGSGMALARGATPWTMGRRFLGASEAFGAEKSGWSAMGGHAAGVSQKAADLVEKFKNINAPPPPKPPAGKGIAF